MSSSTRISAEVESSQMEEQGEKSSESLAATSGANVSDKSDTQGSANGASLVHFSENLSTIFSDMCSKVMLEAQDFNLVLLKNKESELAEERQRHLLEEQKQLQKLEEQQFYISSLEAGIERKELAVENSIKYAQFQQNKLLLSKAFYRWRMYLQARKSEKLLSAVVSEHYETNLKRRVLHGWFNQLKTNWKKRMELKANIEVLEMQKHIVNLYESKIKTLEDNLSEAGRRIDLLLQSKLKLYEESDKMASLMHKAAQPINNKAQYQAASAVDGRIEFEEAGLRAGVYRPVTGVASAPSLCPECSSQTYLGCPARYYTYSKAPPVSYVQSQDESISEVIPIAKTARVSVQNKSLPVMGTSSYLKEPQKCDDLSKAQRSRILIERHVPRPKPITTSRPTSRPLSAKTTSVKKII